MEGPIREKQVLCLGAYRTASSSLAQAMMELGYLDVYHTSQYFAAMPEDLIKTRRVAHFFNTYEEWCHASMSVNPSYNAKGLTRADFDAIFGPAEVIVDMPAYAEDLIRAYPDAKVVLVQRDPDRWVESFLEVFVAPVDWWTARLSGWYMEPLLGFNNTRVVYQWIMGWAGISSRRAMRDRKVLLKAYEAYYDRVRRLVPKEQLLDINLKELDWETLCEFLGKEVPKEKKFPRLNETSVHVNSMKTLHRVAIIGGTLKLCVPLLLGVGGYWLSSWAGRQGYVGDMGASGESVLQTIATGGSLLLGFWWALTRAKF